MSQLIYAFAAVVISAILTMQFFAGSHATRLETHQSEILTQVGAVAGEMFEEIGRRAFDHRTRDDLFDTPPSAASDFTSSRNFGGIPLELCSTQCLDIDDFHRLTFTRQAGGFEFKVRVIVRYVDADNPERWLRGQSFAKEVMLTITNPNIHYPNQPDRVIPIEVGRVFTYQKATQVAT